MTRPSRQKWLIALVLVLLVTNIFTLSIFWTTKSATKKGNSNNGMADRDRRMGQFMVTEMKFDKEQETTYWRLRDSLVVQQKTVMDSIRSTKKNFFDLLKQSTIDDSTLQARSEQIGDLQQKLDLLTFQHFRQVRALCRPDQQQKFDTVVKEIVNRMTSWRRPPGGGKADSTRRDFKH